jgi:signal peptidase II
MQKIKRLALIVTILLCCVGCDQVTKSIARSHLSETQAVILLSGSVRLQVAKNYGAFLSLGASSSPMVRSALFSAGVAAMLVALLAYGLATTNNNPIVVPALGLIVGGGASNLIDRFVNGGYVLDFLNLGFGSLRTGIFDVADVFIMVGVLLLVFSDLLSRSLASTRLRRR